MTPLAPIPNTASSPIAAPGAAPGAAPVRGESPQPPTDESLPRGTRSHPRRFTVSVTGLAADARPWALGVTLFALALCLYRTNVTSLWFDEAYSVGIARQSPAVLWRYLWGPEEHMTLYYVLLHGWLSLTGLLGVVPGEVVVRLPSSIPAALAAGLAVLYGWRFGRSRLVALLGGTLLALNILLLAAAQQARSYALEVLLLLLAWYALAEALERSRERAAAGARGERDEREVRGWLAAAAGMGLLAVYAQIDAAVIIALQPLAVLILLLAGPAALRQHLRTRRFLLMYGASLLAQGLLIVPLAVDVLQHGGQNGWVPPVSWASAWDVVATGIAEGSTPLALLLLATALTGCVAALVRRDPGSVLLVVWLVGGTVLFALVSLPGAHNLHLWYPRYLVVVTPPLCLLAAYGVWACGRAAGAGLAALFGWIGWHLARRAPRVASASMAVALAVVLLALSAHVLPRYYATAQSHDFREPIAWLLARAQPGDGLVCVPVGLCGVGADYYLVANNTIQPGVIPSPYPGEYDFVREKNIPGATLPADAWALTPYLHRHLRADRQVFVLYAPQGGGAAQYQDLTRVLAAVRTAGFRLLAWKQTTTVNAYQFIPAPVIP